MGGYLCGGKPIPLLDEPTATGLECGDDLFKLRIETVPALRVGGPLPERPISLLALEFQPGAATADSWSGGSGSIRPGSPVPGEVLWIPLEVTR